METIGEILNPKAEEKQEEKKEEVVPEKPEEKPEQKPEEKKEASDENKETMVPLHAVQDLRQKNRLLKAELEELKKKASSQETSYAPNFSSEPEASSLALQYKKDRLVQTINNIRATRADAAEMIELFDKAVEQDEVLYDRMFESPDPGTYAYEYGKAIKNQEKYGTTVEEAFDRGMKEAGKKANKEAFENIKNKKDIGEKLPKNISNGGVSGSGSDTGEWTPKSSKEMWS